MSNFEILSNQDKQYVANTYGRFPVAIKEGKGALCKDFDGKEYIAMTNVGVRPSVDGSKRLLETHIFDFDGDLYGTSLRVELIEKIRDEHKFSSVEELRSQIAKDFNNIKERMTKL